MSPAVCVLLFSGTAIPLDRLHLVPLYSAAKLIKEAKADLTEGLALFCGKPVPLSGFFIVLVYTAAMFVHVPQIGLPTRITLSGSFPIPSNSLGIVLLHTGSLLKHQSEVYLGEGIVLIRGLSVPACGLASVLENALPEFVEVSQTILRGRIAEFRILANTAYRFGAVFFGLFVSCCIIPFGLLWAQNDGLIGRSEPTGEGIVVLEFGRADRYSTRATGE